jgi:hypothetical protein
MRFSARIAVGMSHPPLQRGQTRRSERLAVDVGKDTRILSQRPFGRSGTVEHSGDLSRSDERERDAGEQRNAPQRVGHRSREMQQGQPPEGEHDGVDRHLKCPQAQEGWGRALGPLQERLDRFLPGRFAVDPECREMLPPGVERRQLRDGSLPKLHFGCRRRRQQPVCERAVPQYGRRRTDPLIQRRPAEHVQVDRVRMLVEVDSGRRRKRRQSLPMPLHSRLRARVHDTKRFVPGGAILDPGVDGDEGAEDRQQSSQNHEGRGLTFETEPPDQGGHGRDKGGQPQPCQHRGAPPVLIAPDDVPALAFAIACGHRYSGASSPA